MSTAVAQLSKSVEEPTVARPRRRTIASHHRYFAARSTVGELAAAGVPVDEGAIIARDIRPVDGGPRRDIALLTLDGALVGALVGLLLGTFSVFRPLASALVVGLWSLAFGAVVGTVIGLLRRSLSPARPRNGRAVIADTFDVVVDVGVADRASSILRERRAIPIGPPASGYAPGRRFGHRRAKSAHRRELRSARLVRKP
jgi:hypothetical protein